MLKNNFKKTILFTAVFSLIFLSACSIKKDTKEISIDEAKIKAEKFINDNFMDASSTAVIVNIEEDEQTDLYKFTLDLGDGQTYNSYISKDGEEFFPQAYNISDLEESLKATSSESTSTESTEVSYEGFNESADFSTDKKVAIYFFWGDGCPHCSAQKEAMSAWVAKYPDIDIKTYETWNNTNNVTILEDMAKAYGTTVQGVPMTFIGDKYWVGYAESMETEMINKIDECLKGNCENPGDRLK